MDIDKAGRQRQAGCIDNRFAFQRRGRNGRDAAAIERDIGNIGRLAGPVDDLCVADDGGVHKAGSVAGGDHDYSRRNITAIFFLRADRLFGACHRE